MADTIHHALSSFRDTMLTAVARLEFELRDATAATSASTAAKDVIVKAEVQDVTVPNMMTKFEKTLQDITARMNELEIKMTTTSTPVSVQSPTLDARLVQELMSIQLPENSRNVLVPSIRSTPALAAAVAAANVPGLTLGGDSESEVEVVEESEEEVEAEAVEESEGEVVEESEEVSDEESSEPLKKVIIKGETYYMDDDNAVYHETEDGYEQVGTYNPKTDSVEAIEYEEEEEADAEEEEEEAVEVEEFIYKGKTYQRDSENNVYLDGDHIGTWNGKKIVPSTP